MPTGYEKLTDEEIEKKIRQIEYAKYNLEREKRHRKEAAEQEKYKDIIGKIFRYKENESLIVKIKDCDGNSYIGKAIELVKIAGETLMPTSMVFDALIYPNYHVNDLSKWDPITEEEANAIIDKWKRRVDIYVKL